MLCSRRPPAPKGGTAGLAVPHGAGGAVLSPERRGESHLWCSVNAAPSFGIGDDAFLHRGCKSDCEKKSKKKPPIPRKRFQSGEAWRSLRRRSSVTPATRGGARRRRRRLCGNGGSPLWGPVVPGGGEGRTGRVRAARSGRRCGGRSWGPSRPQIIPWVLRFGGTRQSLVTGSRPRAWGGWKMAGGRGGGVTDGLWRLMTGVSPRMANGRRTEPGCLEGKNEGSAERGRRKERACTGG